MKWTGKATLVFFIVVSFILAGEYAWLWHFLEPSRTYDGHKVFVDALGKAWGGTILLAGVFLTAVNLIVTQRNIAAVEAGVEINRKAIENSRLAADESARIAREGQITERFTRAVDQLGSEHDEVRLGAIYALERIAKDSLPDRETILDILCAYVRKNAIATEGKQMPDVMPEDIGTILKVIGRRAESEDEPHYIVDLSATDLRRARFQASRYDFRAGKFIKANLSDTAFFTADLEGAVLSSANLSSALFFGNNFTRCLFDRSDFSSATMGFPRPLGIRDLGDFNAIFRGAQFEDAVFAGTRFLYAAFYDGCRFHRATFTDAIFVRTDLSGAEGLTWQQLRTAQMDAFTCAHLPPYLRPPGTFVQ